MANPQGRTRRARRPVRIVIWGQTRILGFVWEKKIFNTMKYIVYARKSTEEDDRQILSIEAQLVELREFAAKEKLEIVIGAAPPRLGGG